MLHIWKTAKQILVDVLGGDSASSQHNSSWPLKPSGWEIIIFIFNCLDFIGGATSS